MRKCLQLESLWCSTKRPRAGGFAKPLFGSIARLLASPTPKYLSTHKYTSYLPSTSASPTTPSLVTLPSTPASLANLQSSDFTDHQPRCHAEEARNWIRRKEARSRQSYALEGLLVGKFPLGRDGGCYPRKGGRTRDSCWPLSRSRCGCLSENLRVGLRDPDLLSGRDQNRDAGVGPKRKYVSSATLPEWNSVHL